MGAPTMKPMEVSFKNDRELEKFLNWAESKEKNNSPNMKKVREGVKRAREMRKNGRFQF
jgi:hypothetical protein